MNVAKEVKDILTKLQNGYDEKNPKNASVLMAQIFSNRQDLLTLGTSSSEVCLGHAEVEKLIHDDWDGGWGDFKIDIDGAKIESSGETAWFYANCTVKYSFENTTEKSDQYVEWVKKIAEKHDTSPKQRISFINWALGLAYNQRQPGKREYLWLSELSGMLIKESGEWKIACLHFAVPKPNYPDERFEELVEDYQEGHRNTKNKILSHSGNKPDSELKNLLEELKNDTDLGDLHFDEEQTLVFDAGKFAWIIALGVAKKSISEDEILDNSLQEISKLLTTNLPSEDKLFMSKRSIIYALKEIAFGTEFTWPIRLTAVVEKSEGKLRHKHLSYPFYWILEEKLSAR